MKTLRDEVLTGGFLRVVKAEHRQRGGQVWTFECYRENHATGWKTTEASFRPARVSNPQEYRGACTVFFRWLATVEQE